MPALRLGRGSQIPEPPAWGEPRRRAQRARGDAAHPAPEPDAAARNRMSPALWLVVWVGVVAGFIIGYSDGQGAALLVRCRRRQGASRAAARPRPEAVAPGVLAPCMILQRQQRGANGAARCQPCAAACTHCILSHTRTPVQACLTHLTPRTAVAGHFVWPRQDGDAARRGAERAAASKAGDPGVL